MLTPRQRPTRTFLNPRLEQLRELSPIRQTSCCGFFCCHKENKQTRLQSIGSYRSEKEMMHGADPTSSVAAVVAMDEDEGGGAASVGGQTCGDRLQKGSGFYR
jgi:hypothetical protein